MAKVSRIIGEQLFPERQLLLQSSGGVRHLSLPGWFQAMVLAACLVSVGGIVYLAVGFAHLHEAIDSRVVVDNTALNLTNLQNLQASNPVPSPSPAAPAPVVDNTALIAMRQEVAQMRDQLAAVNKNFAEASARADQTRDQLASLSAVNVKLRKDIDDSTGRAKTLQEARDEADRRVKTVEQALQAASTKSGNLAQLTKSLDDNKAELRQSEAQRTTLQNRVQQLQMELQAQAQQSANVRPAVAPAQAQAVVVPPPDPKPTPPTTVSRVPAATPAPVSVPAVVTSPDSHSDASVPHSQGAVSQLEQLLASTGLNIDRMLGKLGSAPNGQGGPYIALNTPQASSMDSRRFDDLKQLAKVLPLASPLNSYQLESVFGARVDPINHHASFHPGLDMSAPYMTQVYSTGPGVVSFTGTEKDYGRVVEIDHGHGIVTRYAHLHRILVARGQKVGVHFPIGELGSTGRSTGPHVHYEVHVDGSPVDPAKFMEAGKNVVQISGK